MASWMVTNKDTNQTEAGGILIISASKHISFDCDLGAGTNNFEEVKAATILMNLAKERLKYLHIPVKILSF